MSSCRKNGGTIENRARDGRLAPDLCMSPRCTDLGVHRRLAWEGRKCLGWRYLGEQSFVYVSMCVTAILASKISYDTSLTG